MKGRNLLKRLPSDDQRLAWRLASGQGDLIYAVTLLAFLIAVLRALLM